MKRPCYLRLLCGALVTALGLTATSAHAQNINLNFSSSNPTWRIVDCTGVSGVPNSGSPKQWYLLDNTSYSNSSQRFLFTTKNPGQSQPFPLITSTLGYDGTRGLRLTLNNSLAGGSQDGLDKINLRAVDPAASYAPTISPSVTRYVGFAIRLGGSGSTFEAPSAKMLLVQWWQGSPWEPPLRLELNTNTNAAAGITYKFSARDDTEYLGAAGNPSRNLPITSGKNTLDRNRWYRFIIMTKFDPGGGGRVKVWRSADSTSGGSPESLLYSNAGIVDYTGKIGYTPGWDNNTSSAGAASTIGIFFGPYRDNQDRVHNVDLDDIKFGTSFDQVKSGP